MSTRIAFACLIALLPLLIGCSGESVGPVTGTVTHRGKPVPEIGVIFVPEKGQPSRGLSDENGHYILRYQADKDGALVGKHKVWVQLRPTSPKDEKAIQIRIAKLAHDPTIKRILEKYGNYETTPLAFDVKSSPQVIDLPLD
jgi:hypothetical protein